MNESWREGRHFLNRDDRGERSSTLHERKTGQMLIVNICTGVRLLAQAIAHRSDARHRGPRSSGTNLVLVRVDVLEDGHDRHEQPVSDAVD